MPRPRYRQHTFEIQIIERIQQQRNQIDSSYLSSNFESSLGFSINGSSETLSSLRSLGIDTTSYESIRNLHRPSYLKGIENGYSKNDQVISDKTPQNEAVELEKELEKPDTNKELPKAEPAKVEPPKAEPSKAANDKDPEITADQTEKNSIKDKLLSGLKLKNSINPQSQPYLLWLALVSFCFVYNIVSISIRFTFLNDSAATNDNLVNQTLPLNGTNNATSTQIELEGAYGVFLKYFIQHEYYWLLLDYCSDIIYLVDIFLVQTRKKFLSEGLWVSDFKQTRMTYFKTTQFIIDILSILPVELFQLSSFVASHAFFRINRIFKFHTMMEFFDRWDMAVQTYTFLVRLLRLLIYLQIVIHIYSCVYYKISVWETSNMDIDNEWVYITHHSHIQKYVFSFLFGLKTASTIGNTPQPKTREEYLFTAIAYVVSLFLFASIVGQIRNIIGSLSTKQDAFLIIVDTTNKYFQNLHLPRSLSNKINLWFDYYIKEENAVPFKAIGFLPKSVQTDLAIAVYLNLISKVKLFQECEKNLLYALVLILKPVTYMPGDFICLKGEVGREMFIVVSGVVEVIVKIDGVDKAVAQMKEGSCFGEISLLSIGDGGNRRTASIVSKGFSKLLVLHKTDFNRILADYPEMQQVLQKSADSYMKKK